MKTALLGAAATALTVKGALTSPIGVVAQGPLDKLKHTALDQAGARLVAGIAASDLRRRIARTVAPRRTP